MIHVVATTTTTATTAAPTAATTAPTAPSVATPTPTTATATPTHPPQPPPAPTPLALFHPSIDVLRLVHFMRNIRPRRPATLRTGGDSGEVAYLQLVVEEDRGGRPGPHAGAPCRACISGAVAATATATATATITATADITTCTTVSVTASTTTLNPRHTTVRLIQGVRGVPRPSKISIYIRRHHEEIFTHLF